MLTPTAPLARVALFQSRTDLHRYGPFPPITGGQPLAESRFGMCAVVGDTQASSRSKRRTRREVVACFLLSNCYGLSRGVGGGRIHAQLAIGRFCSPWQIGANLVRCCSPEIS